MSNAVPSEQSMEQNTVEFNISRFLSMSTILWLKGFLLKRLPLELVDLVLDFAEYWAHTTAISPKLGLVRTPVKWRDTSLDILSSTWPSPESEAMREVFGFTLYSPPLALESSLTRAATLKKGLRRLVRRDEEICLPPRGQHPARMVVFEVFSQRCESHTGKFGDIGIIREDDHSLKQHAPVSESQRRNSSGLPVFRSNVRLSRSARSDKTHQLVAQRDCWFSPRAKAEGKYVIKWKYDDDTIDRLKKQDDDNVFPTIRNFLGELKVGDMVGLWAPVARGNCINWIDEVRLHTFWAV